MKNKIIIYMHGGSNNHGCEAIVRGLSTILSPVLNEECLLISDSIKSDIAYGLDKTIKPKILETYNVNGSFLRHCIAKLCSIVTKDLSQYAKYSYGNVIRHVGKDDVALSVGGDTYCYGEMPTYLAELNRMFTKAGAKTVLYGCSVEPALLESESVLRDLEKYSLIIARESITYNALTAKKLSVPVICLPDPAFSMRKKECGLPKAFIRDATVGVNISPIITNGNFDNVMMNYMRLIEYILSQTGYSVALIPHVVRGASDDTAVAKKLKEQFANETRVFVCNDAPSDELKYIISQCTLFIGTRTHSTIAAYSERVPTLVIGYSVKSRGIACDIFGTSENYVVNYKELNDTDALLKSFVWLNNNRDEITRRLDSVIPDYIKKSSDAYGYIADMLNVNEGI